MSAIPANSAIDALGLSVAQKAPPASTRGELGQDDFLLLMTTQLRNQDPTQPMDNGAFLGQLAQFSTVSGIQDMQSGFADLANSLYTNQALLGSSLVGRTVLVPARTVALGAEGSVQGRIAGAADADVRVRILDAAGKPIRTLAPSSDENGMVFTWDGLDAAGQRLPAGDYEVEVVGDAENGSPTVGLEQEVVSVSLGRAGQSLQLNLANGEQVELTRVQQIR
jgi:flagellar basal-body rod modification protein FlgD